MLLDVGATGWVVRRDVCVVDTAACSQPRSGCCERNSWWDVGLLFKIFMCNEFF